MARWACRFGEALLIVRLAFTPTWLRSAIPLPQGRGQGVMVKFQIIISPARVARITASVRLCAPSLPMMALT